MSDQRIIDLAAAIGSGEGMDMPLEDVLANWALLNSPLGTYAKWCAKGSLEVATLRAELATAQRERDEARTDVDHWMNECRSSLRESDQQRERADRLAAALAEFLVADESERAAAVQARSATEAYNLAKSHEARIRANAADAHWLRAIQRLVLARKHAMKTGGEPTAPSTAQASTEPAQHRCNICGGVVSFDGTPPDPACSALGAGNRKRKPVGAQADGWLGEVLAEAATAERELPEWARPTTQVEQAARDDEEAG